MDSNSVPLWAFLLTALAAVVGPFVTTWAGNRNARKLLAQQHANERAMYLLDKKHELYEETLRLFGDADIQTALGDQNATGAAAGLTVAVERLRLHAPDDVQEAARQANFAYRGYYLAVRAKPLDQDRMAESSRNYDARVAELGQAIRRDMDTERAAPLSMGGSGR